MKELKELMDNIFECKRSNKERGLVDKSWMSIRLWRFIMERLDIVSHYKWSAQCGNWVVIVCKSPEYYVCNPGNRKHLGST